MRLIQEKREKMVKILITGGTGFLGYHLAVELSKDKNNKIFLASKTLHYEDDGELAKLLSSPNITLIEGDLTNKLSWKKVGSDYDFVYHLVSIKGFKNFNEIPHEVLRVGILSTLNVIDWFKFKNGKPQAKILYTSSNEVYNGGVIAYGKITNPTPENIPCVIPDTYDPRWSYAGQKLIGELLFIHYSKAYNFRMSIVRPVNIYGPRAGYDGMIPKIIKQVVEHADHFTILGPEDKRTFCFVEDVVDALIKVTKSQKTDGQTYNIGDDHLTSVREITELIFNVAGWHPEKVIFENSPREAVRNSVPDISKIEKDTGWKPATSLQKGIEKTVDWYLRHS
ncbi:MAG: hypothetical protein A3C79_02060 [Candidatus Taylorbacteria bacterium RIFCSPHIGHO2_02_FULL_45_28]|uniref:NAD-dependent epimerase/dehydratase domain-containing protein n=1 Tax=Candidatus Taylorbacteria bacterium RIFCSPHIGHO2_12_FULL_45_16 TaxID=1802315 RepID=A0A1G2N068_9BACT|nr:MAG: hypothetical protein A2830_02865 [Candidatus Taylorbacteria bacterium RIFCSPHIGHO2_01_FULL_44_110]OHA25235.1 MAG: hypothetical protein A3C79_02060 [Candidatus Taylorbacteria bacterium RIFCSPHIGHO2_02_FULL_45_28]OHA29478.1 MAG: hypothetical protein A3F51_00370 [Candidatus Taylorbacteria bacterium RIFCSPHIGHO2_12_FULL_45_16]OHA33240.1 MAG: hypothetical protein A3A23_02900 [Candidatus Taylorbacteria bacterium RIFCSPLOWO2_01_FULL_45_59]OHA38289.1 MAG: hypothetical protein A3I98_03165 [Candi